MKPKNMPERKNARRKAALQRLGNADRPMTKKEIVERHALDSSIVANARDVRTKKAGGRIERQAAWRRNHPL